MTRAVIRTHVGRADHGSNTYFGYRVETELFGQETLTSLLAMGVTGRRASPRQRAVLDAMAVALSSADPRIWMFKATRLGAAYGGMVSGLVAGQLCLHRARVGHLTCSEAARALHRMAARAGGLDDPEAFRASVREELRERGRLIGFGVPFRREDERALALAAHVRSLGAGGPWLAALEGPVADVVREEQGLEPNGGAYVAAILTDVGFQPREVGPLVFAMGLHGFVANAVEGAEQAPPVLQRLPPDRVRYDGPPPRRSPRADGTEP
ncbi:MAG: citrate/2-methylcitrate synthase [Sandaracinaceae bacterium]